MYGGYMGKVLFINLTSGSINEEVLREERYRHFIGATGLGVRVLYERMEAKVDPLSVGSMLGFITGPLTGITIDQESLRANYYAAMD